MPNKSMKRNSLPLAVSALERRKCTLAFCNNVETYEPSAAKVGADPKTPLCTKQFLRS
jgi:hypothetical protein